MPKWEQYLEPEREPEPSFEKFTKKNKVGKRIIEDDEQGREDKTNERQRHEKRITQRGDEM